MSIRRNFHSIKWLRRNGIRRNRSSVKWYFGEISLRWNIPSAKWLRRNGFLWNGFRRKVWIPYFIYLILFFYILFLLFWFYIYFSIGVRSINSALPHDLFYNFYILSTLTSFLYNFALTKSDFLPIPYI
jgi:hypothetical protein